MYRMCSTKMYTLLRCEYENILTYIGIITNNICNTHNFFLTDSTKEYIVFYFAHQQHKNHLN